jgi:hypothetical protein
MMLLILKYSNNLKSIVFSLLFKYLISCKLWILDALHVTSGLQCAPCNKTIPSTRVVVSGRMSFLSFYLTVLNIALLAYSCALSYR